MAAFVNTPARWTGSPVVHLVWNSVWERTSKWARCAAKIGPGAQYGGVHTEPTSYDFEALVPTCPACLASVNRVPGV